MTRTRRPRSVVLLSSLALLTLSAVGAATAPIPWEDLTEADWIYNLATRVATIEGRQVHYPTPTAELARQLEARSEGGAWRYLADVRLALGDRAGARAALEKWAAAEGATAWAEAAQWGAEHDDWGLTFRAAASAIGGLGADEQRQLADRQIGWADAHPEAGDPLALRRIRAELFPNDGNAVEDYLRALEKAGRLDELDKALAATQALAADRRLLLRSDLAADHGNVRRAFEILDTEQSDGPWSIDLCRAYAQRVASGNPGAPETWRAGLDRAFVARDLQRLTRLFEGQNRGDAATELLRQVERRHGVALDRAGWTTLGLLYREVDAIPEAFRAALNAAARPAAGQPASARDLEDLATLALRAGSRPLGWGLMNDEPYRWVARVDRTPGFWTGGLSFLLTGQDWTEALARLESAALPDRTFAVARALTERLAQQTPTDEGLPRLRLALMQRHVERGEPREALALLPGLEQAPHAVADAARRTALLAARQTGVSLDEEKRLFRARLRHLALDGSRPAVAEEERSYEAEHDYGAEGLTSGLQTQQNAWTRHVPSPRPETYATVLNEMLTRMDARDRTHRAALDIILSELDRLPDAEGLWESLIGRLESWSLDDDLGPRYERALQRFQGAGWWSRLARWYAKRSRTLELRHLADDIAQRFRGSALFERVATTDIRLSIPEQPVTSAGQVRLVLFADWVRLRALERFPHSPRVYREAAGRLLRLSALNEATTNTQWAKERSQRAIVADALLDTREAALLFVDKGIRDSFLATLFREGKLRPFLARLEGQSSRTPAEDILLADGWSRLSHFEQATPAADRLAAAYPGDGELATRALTLHRSLAGLDLTHAGPARAIVERAAPALADPNPLWTSLGELEEESGHPESSSATWRHLLEREPRNPEKINELATLLWDYGHTAEALAVVEDGRQRLGRPRLMAFETGVLREEMKDVDGAVREYLAALVPESGRCYCSVFESDQRSLRRLTQLAASRRPLALALARIEGLTPGVAADEEALAAIFPFGTITQPLPGLEWDVDDWIDALALPNDPVGRRLRDEQREQERPRWDQNIARIADALLEKTLVMVPKATTPEFVDAAERMAGPLVTQRWPQERWVDFSNALLTRRAELAPTEEDRIAREVSRARFLADHGRTTEADALWTRLMTRVNALPDGAPKLRAEVERAAYLERTSGVAAAEKAWVDLARRYPWSLGILEDQVAFLTRHERAGEGRALIEAALPRAAAGHREALLERLTREALATGDLPQARRAVSALVGLEGLDESRRLGALQLLARLSFRESKGFDALGLAQQEAPRFRTDLHADLYRALATAAEDEGLAGAAVALWIEALNRRLERAWLVDACRAADDAGQAATLRAFFEKQRQRSPRDVRWAVAIREIRRHQRDVAGAVEAAQAAVAVRPERESLWREAADLMVRADRVREAADYLEGWNRPRPADEAVATWRAELYARAGDGERALAIERAALEAFSRAGALDEARSTELRERTARAARRLIELGHAELAWRLAAPGGSLQKLAESGLYDREQAQLALTMGSFAKLLRARLDKSEDFVNAAAEVLAEHGRPEQREEVTTYLLSRLFPTPVSTGDNAALRKLWPFVNNAGLEPFVRRAIALRIAAAKPGPWGAAPPEAFLADIGGAALVWRNNQLSFQAVEVEALWVTDLVRHDRAKTLAGFLAPRWLALLGRINGPLPLAANTPALGWTKWLSNREALELWTRVAGPDPASVKALAPLFSERRLWDRFWLFGARDWDVAPLLAILPPEARSAWFRFWEDASIQKDPVRRARAESVALTSLAVGRLVAGTPDATRDPLLVRLRGPRTIGDVLGNDPRWTWPEFVPRKDASGNLAETGDDRVIGQGADNGRLPGALWGERPGEAWYVLEALARYREKDLTTPHVPLEVPKRGAETERALVAIRAATGLGQNELAFALAEAHLAAGADTERLALRLGLMLAANRRDLARQTYEAHVRSRQAKLNEESYRRLAGLAEDLALPAPLDLLRPDQPIAPAFLAYLFDQRGATVAARFRTADASGFRAALAARWAPRQASLAAEQIRYWVTELWTREAAALPRRGLAKLGGLWPHAADWLERIRPAERAEAVAAVAAFPDTTRFEAVDLRTPEPGSEAAQLLLVRVLLTRRDDTRALALVDKLLAGLDPERPLTLGTFEPVVTAVEGEGAGEAYADGEDQGQDLGAETDNVASRLASWLSPFRDVKRAAPVEERLRTTLAARRRLGRVPLASWRLALELTLDGPARLALLADLDHAWVRGDWRPEDLAPLCETLAKTAPQETTRWLTRWPRRFDLTNVQRRVKVHEALQDIPGATAVVLEGVRRGPLNAADELRAFDLWRRFVPDAALADAPPGWAAALPFWRQKAGEILPALRTRLVEHPQDVRAARAVLRTVAPGDEETLRLALVTLQSPVMNSIGNRYTDERFVALRVARGLLPTSWRAAHKALPALDPAWNAGELIRRHIRKPDVDESLADLARIAGRAGDTRAFEAAVGLLVDRTSPLAQTLRAELAEMTRPSARLFLTVDGKPAPFKPRDLTWRLVADVLSTEGVR